MENCLGFSLFLVCILVGKGVDAQSAGCQSAYNAFQSLPEACRTALPYVTSGRPLVPLQSTFSDSDLDTLCSSSCLSQFTAYFSNCITQGSSPGATDVSVREENLVVDNGRGSSLYRGVVVNVSAKLPRTSVHND